MGRPRTGSLELRDTPSGKRWHLRFTVTVRTIDGKPKSERRILNLETADRKLAEKLQRNIVGSIASGTIAVEDVGASKHEASIADYFDYWNKPRVARGVRFAEKQASQFNKHVRDRFGPRALSDVAPQEWRDLWSELLATLKRDTVTNIRRTMLGMYEHAFDADLLHENQIRKAKVPEKREHKKERAILRDDEVELLLLCDRVPVYFRMMCFSARAAGGMRAGDVNTWDWQSIDLERERCVVPRMKSGKPQELVLPHALGVALRAWWLRSGNPTSGLVFPVMIGPRRGQPRAYGTSFGVRLRHWLVVAGVARHELHNETRHTRPVDFHSFRRSFATALAEADVNEQKAMRLTGHTSPSVHRRYLMNTERMKVVPEKALPQLSAETVAVLARAGQNPSVDPKKP